MNSGVGVKVGVSEAKTMVADGSVVIETNSVRVGTAVVGNGTFGVFTGVGRIEQASPAIMSTRTMTIIRFCIKCSIFRIQCLTANERAS